jgi:diguanylate cyclase (GGDEF)-like protein
VKIGEFAEMNQVTTKMLRYYDEVGLLKPALVDHATGYRSYDPEQAHVLNWILILKNLDFPLAKIKALLSGPTDSRMMIDELIRKRIEISSALNVQIQKKIDIDKLINILEKEGFRMEAKIDLLSIEPGSVHEIKKNIPNMEMFLETANSIASLCSADDSIAVFRFDISHFKQVNDTYGFDVGDQVIVACYQIIQSNVNESLKQATLGRAHGDEFIVFAAAHKEEIEQTASDIFDDLAVFDFSSIGYPHDVRGYIGGVISRKKTLGDLRKMIEDSIEVIEQARKKGPNRFVVESYH